MSNALLAMSGPAFGNMDVTVYDVYSITTTTAVSSESNAVTIFSGRSWTWAIFDINVYGFMIPRPIVVSNSVSISNETFSLSSISTQTTRALFLYGTSTSLKGGNARTEICIMTAYVPSA